MIIPVLDKCTQKRSLKVHAMEINSISAISVGQFTAFITKSGARCRSVVEWPLMMQWVIRSIPHGGPNELFLIPTSAVYVISCL